MDRDKQIQIMGLAVAAVMVLLMAAQIYFAVLCALGYPVDGLCR